MFKFEEIKETLEKYPYNKLMADYEIRQKSNYAKSDEVADEISSFLDFPSYILPFDAFSNLNIYIACLRNNNDFRKIAIIKDLLAKYSYRYSNEILCASQYIDQLQTNDYPQNFFDLIARGLLSIEKITQNGDDFFLETYYSKIKITNPITDVPGDKRRGYCHNVTSDFLISNNNNYYGAYYYIPLPFVGFLEHSVVIDEDNKKVLDFANNSVIDLEIWQKIYPNCSFVISAKDFKTLYEQMMDSYDIALQPALLEEVKRKRTRK